MTNSVTQQCYVQKKTGGGGTAAVEMGFQAQRSVPPTLIKVVLMKISAAEAQGGCWSCSGECELGLTWLD